MLDLKDIKPLNTRSYKIGFVGNFDRTVSVGEPEIALALTELGHEVYTLNEGCSLDEVDDVCKDIDFLLVSKFRCGTPNDREVFMKRCNVPIITWLFDLYCGL